MNIDKFFVVLNTFILFVTLSTISSETGKPEDDMSEDSKTMYNLLTDEKQKTAFMAYYNKKINKQDMYNGFLCATYLLEAQLKELYPQFKGEWKEDKVRGKLTNPNYYSFMQNIHSCYQYPTDLKYIQSRIDDSRVESKYNIKETSRAKVKMPNFFRHMFALLTRYDDPNFKEYLKDESYKNAEDIMKLIIPKHNTFIYSTENSIIECFSVKYAYIRHSFNIFSPYQIREAVIELEEKDRTRRSMNQGVNLTDGFSAEIVAPIGIQIHLCDVLHYMGILQAWNFTEQDLQFMNDVSQVADPRKKAMYDPYYCYLTDGNGRTTSVILPVTDYRHCPVLPKQFTAPTTQDYDMNFK